MPACSGSDTRLVPRSERRLTSERSLGTRSFSEPGKGGIANGRGASDCVCVLPRSGALALHRLGLVPPDREKAASSYRPGHAGRALGQGESLAMAPDPLAQRQSPGRQAGDRESWQEHAGCGRGNLVHPRGENRRGEVTAAEGVSTPTAAAGLHPKVEREAETSWHPHDEGPRDAGPPLPTAEEKCSARRRKSAALDWDDSLHN